MMVVKTTISIIGMTCAGCAATIEKAVVELEFVRDVAINVSSGKALVEFDSGESHFSGIVHAVRRAGYDVETIKSTLQIGDISCAACISKIEKKLDGLPGIVGFSVNLTSGKAGVEYVTGIISEPAIVAQIEALGYKAKFDSVEDGGSKRKLNWHQIRLIVALIFSIPLFILSMFVDMFFEVPYLGWIMLALSTPVQFFSGYIFYEKTMKGLLHRNLGMDSLVAIGSSAAYIYSVYALVFDSGHLYFESAAVIISLVLLGRWLEDRAKRKTTSAVEKLTRLSPDIAHRLTDGVEEDIAANALIVGDLFVVRPGERIPADGTVVSGNSEVNQASITGENLPVFRTSGDAVVGATLNSTGSLTVRADAVGEQTTFSRIIKLVEQAQSSKAPIQRLADRVASIFVPIVIAASLLTFAIWILLGASVGVALLSSVAVLVVACPCAMGLATPAAITTGTGRGAELGILIKDANVLETFGKIRAIAFDKTGTLTIGQPAVVALYPASGITEETLLANTAAAETPTEHILGRAIVEYAKLRNIDVPKCDGFQSFPGRGVVADVGSTKIFVGRASFLEDEEFTILAESHLIEATEKGYSLIYVGTVQNNERRYIGAIALADEIKKGTAQTISKLKAAALEVSLLTGDSSASAKNVAMRVGIDNVKSELLPDDKLSALRESRRPVAMVGDGVNDAPALAFADIGIAVGSGMGVAIDAADVILPTSDISSVELAYRLSKTTLRVIKQNLFWAFIYNIIMLPLAAIGILNPMFAAAAMGLSSISVVVNSLRLKRFGK